MIHSREAAADTMEIMKKYGKDLNGVITATLFTGDGTGVCENGLLHRSRWCGNF